MPVHLFLFKKIYLSASSMPLKMVMLKILSLTKKRAYSVMEADIKKFTTQYDKLYFIVAVCNW